MCKILQTVDTKSLDFCKKKIVMCHMSHDTMKGLETDHFSNIFNPLFYQKSPALSFPVIDRGDIFITYFYMNIATSRLDFFFFSIVTAKYKLTCTLLHLIFLTVPTR